MTKSRKEWAEIAKSQNWQLTHEQKLERFRFPPLEEPIAGFKLLGRTEDFVDRLMFLNRYGFNK